MSNMTRTNPKLQLFQYIKNHTYTCYIIIYEYAGIFINQYKLFIVDKLNSNIVGEVYYFKII